MTDDIQVEFGEDFLHCLDALETGQEHLFVTGKAGTGKSTILSYFRKHTKRKVVVLAPTGVAALNVRGQTIHSFFKFPLHVSPDSIERPKGESLSLMKTLDTLVIDEASMLRADLLDCIDQALRLARKRDDVPFGGARLVLFGDLYQLPPVLNRDEESHFAERYNSPYFFSGMVMRDVSLRIIELHHVYRQQDEDFIHVLNTIRDNSAGKAELDLLNERYQSTATLDRNAVGMAIHLAPTNRKVTEINETHLALLPGKMMRFESEGFGAFERTQFPAEDTLIVKEGAQVMLLTNDLRKRWVNGSIATVVGKDRDEIGQDAVVVEFSDGTQVAVGPHTWELTRYKLMESGVIGHEVVGSYTQYPLRLAWAVTIHKSQGKTFDRVLLDMDTGTFAHGQAYVALSRVRTLEGLLLVRPIEARHIITDPRIGRWMAQYREVGRGGEDPTGRRVAIIETAIEEGANITLEYLKQDGSLTIRTIRPRKVELIDFSGKEFLGVSGYCHLRKEERTFRIDRILSLRGGESASSVAEPETEPSISQIDVAPITPQRSQKLLRKAIPKSGVIPKFSKWQKKKPGMEKRSGVIEWD